MGMVPYFAHKRNQTLATKLCLAFDIEGLQWAWSVGHLGVHLDAHPVEAGVFPLSSMASFLPG